MFVYNAFRPDIRVLKEAKSLLDAGYQVEVLALQDNNNTVPFQDYDGVKVHRFRRNPFHERLLAWWNGRRKSSMKNKIKSDPRSHFFSFLDKFSLALVKTILLFLAIVGAVEFLSYIIQSAFFREYKYLLYGALLILVLARSTILRNLRRIFAGTVNRRIFTGTVKMILLPFYRYFNYLSYYTCCFRHVSSARADIYHAHDLNTLAIAWWCRRRFGGALVYDSHELFTEANMMTKSDRKIWAFAEQRLIRKCDQVITVCDSIALELRDRYKIALPKVLRNCPWSTFLSTRSNLIRESAGISADTPVVLYQGGFSNNRGLRKLLLAAGYFETGILVMMGWGNIEDELREFVVANNLQDRVRFIPPAPQKDLLSWSSSADIGVIPYRATCLNNFYSCPNKLFEYINAGVPVAGSAFPEISRIIDEWKIGVTFDPESPKDIARAINFVLSNYLLIKEMRENARQAAKNLNWECESAKLLALYRDLDRPNRKD